MTPSLLLNHEAQQPAGTDGKLPIILRMMLAGLTQLGILKVRVGGGSHWVGSPVPTWHLPTVRDVSGTSFLSSLADSLEISWTVLSLVQDRQRTTSRHITSRTMKQFVLLDNQPFSIPVRLLPRSLTYPYCTHKTDQGLDKCGSLLGKRFREKSPLGVGH